MAPHFRLRFEVTSGRVILSQRASSPQTSGLSSELHASTCLAMMSEAGSISGDYSGLAEPPLKLTVTMSDQTAAVSKLAFTTPSLKARSQHYPLENCCISPKPKEQVVEQSTGKHHSHDFTNLPRRSPRLHGLLHTMNQTLNPGRNGSRDTVRFAQKVLKADASAKATKPAAVHPYQQMKAGTTERPSRLRDRAAMRVRTGGNLDTRLAKKMAELEEGEKVRRRLPECARETITEFPAEARNAEAAGRHGSR